MENPGNKKENIKKKYKKKDWYKTHNA